MPYDWEGNRRSCVALAMRHSLQWFIHLRTQWLNEGRWALQLHCSKEYCTLYLYITCFSGISKKCPGQPGLSYCRTVCSSYQFTGNRALQVEMLCMLYMQLVADGDDEHFLLNVWRRLRRVVGISRWERRPRTWKLPSGMRRRWSGGSKVRNTSTRPNGYAFTLAYFSYRVYRPLQHITAVVMATVCNRAGHCIFALWFLSIFFFFSFLA